MELYFKQYGAGPPLIILHGLLGSSGNWHTLAGKVFAEHFTVYAVDQRNHGRSPHDDVLDYPAMAGDLAAFVQRHGLGRVHVLGHSMGGKTAMFFALAHGEEVDRLVVADMAPRAYPPQHATLIDALAGLDLSAYASRQQVDAALAPAVPEAAVRQFLLKNLVYDSDARRYGWQMNLDVIRRSQAALGAGVPTGQTFDGPALFVRGSASGYVRDEDVAGIRQLFPRAEVATVEAGHWVHAEAPEAFARVVLAFLLRP